MQDNAFLHTGMVVDLHDWLNSATRVSICCTIFEKQWSFFVFIGNYMGIKCVALTSTNFISFRDYMV